MPGVYTSMCVCLCVYTLYVYMSACICLSVGLQVSITGLERELHHYTLEPTETCFDLKSVPLAAQPVVEQPAAAPGEAPVVKTTEKVAATRQDVYAGLLFVSSQHCTSFQFSLITVS